MTELQIQFTIEPYSYCNLPKAIKGGSSNLNSENTGVNIYDKIDLMPNNHQDYLYNTQSEETTQC